MLSVITVPAEAKPLQDERVPDFPRMYHLPAQKKVLLIGGDLDEVHRILFANHRQRARIGRFLATVRRRPTEKAAFKFLKTIGAEEVVSGAEKEKPAPPSPPAGVGAAAAAAAAAADADDKTLWIERVNDETHEMLAYCLLGNQAAFEMDAQGRQNRNVRREEYLPFVYATRKLRRTLNVESFFVKSDDDAEYDDVPEEALAVCNFYKKMAELVPERPAVSLFVEGSDIFLHALADRRLDSRDSKVGGVRFLFARTRSRGGSAVPDPDLHRYMYFSVTRRMNGTFAASEEVKNANPENRPFVLLDPHWNTAQRDAIRTALPKLADAAASSSVAYAAQFDHINGMHGVLFPLFNPDFMGDRDRYPVVSMHIVFTGGKARTDAVKFTTSAPIDPHDVSVSSNGVILLPGGLPAYQAKAKDVKSVVGFARAMFIDNGMVFSINEKENAIEAFRLVNIGSYVFEPEKQFPLGAGRRTVRHLSLYNALLAMVVTAENESPPLHYLRVFHVGTCELVHEVRVPHASCYPIVAVGGFGYIDAIAPKLVFYDQLSEILGDSIRESAPRKPRAAPRVPRSPTKQRQRNINARALDDRERMRYLHLLLIRNYVNVDRAIEITRVAYDRIAESSVFMRIKRASDGRFILFGEYLRAGKPLTPEELFHVNADDLFGVYALYRPRYDFTSAAPGIAALRGDPAGREQAAARLADPAFMETVHKLHPQWERFLASIECGGVEIRGSVSPDFPVERLEEMMEAAKFGHLDYERVADPILEQAKIKPLEI